MVCVEIVTSSLIQGSEHIGVFVFASSSYVNTPPRSPSLRLFFLPVIPK